LAGQQEVGVTIGQENLGKVGNLTWPGKVTIKQTACGKEWKN